MRFEPRIIGGDGADKREDVAKAGGPPGKPATEDARDIAGDVDALGLPDDLAALAGQLSDDAQYLAACHPADATPEQRARAYRETSAARGNGKRKRALSRWLMRGAAAVLAAVAAWGAWQWLQPPAERGHLAGVANSGSVESPAESTVSSPQPQGSELAKGQDSSDTTNADEATGSDELTGDQPRLIPAGFLRDVSGPELDGMLELLEQEEAGLSI